jgi:hypothetical protein
MVAHRFSLMFFVVAQRVPSPAFWTVALWLLAGVRNHHFGFRFF